MPDKLDIYTKVQNNCKFLYGVFHGHSSLSIGQGSPTECYSSAYHNGLDFLILSEHSDFLSSDKIKWEKGLEQTTRFMKKKEDFISLFGFEGKTNFLNELNIINSKTYFNGSINDIRLLPIWMINNPSAFIIISNPLKNICNITYNSILDKLITAIEVTAGSSNRYLHREKYYFSLLDKGFKLGAVNGLSESKLSFGETENLTCVVASKFTKDSFINAIRSHQSYSTESKTLKLLYFINDTFMGGILPNTNDLRFTIIIEDRNYIIEKIEIISNTGLIIHTIENIGLNKIKYLYNHKKEISETWYVIKVHQATNKQAISSPIFINS